MRLWSLHPRYLDSRGLVALWREALLAQAVLREQTRGYRHHPQLARFRTSAAPLDAVAAYLGAVHAEATRRGYGFDPTKLRPPGAEVVIPVTTGQLAYEWQHLLAKLAVRDPAAYERIRDIGAPECHPLFQPCEGSVEMWERLLPSDGGPAGRGKPRRGDGNG
ncbi:pyrimidine dimer DNA glycosylase/endonuclease V [Ramlibacter tataouinensis]|uniref:pyrimidine dimer DNA glycosylase/endonuclease V n=1 Tax=Ramlibacter tataouinensis TaxID=94132 RepID=UPI0022F3F960|nr:pyrimidine dimer DNA glycosylase/endonuclease V [Ramlibacter tataouinensis]WBY02413.1 pyrimidine dimer DNA glycosylase/endonuclease V [Ramlibacter tataouinensis]